MLGRVQPAIAGFCSWALGRAHLPGSILVGSRGNDPLRSKSLSHGPRFSRPTRKNRYVVVGSG